MAQGDTPVPGPSRSESCIAQPGHLTRYLYLKGETAKTGITLDDEEKNETKPISHNLFTINSLR